MGSLLKFMQFVLGNFGPIIAFTLLNRWLGLKAAIVASLLVTVLEVLNVKVRRKENLSLFFKFSVFISIVCGVIDLSLTNSILFRYEATLINLATAAYFGATLFADQPIMIELARRSGKFNREITPAFITYFRYVTFAWVVYFVLKGLTYAWISSSGRSIEELIILRLVIGNGSLALMIFISAAGGRYLYLLLQKLGLLPVAPASVTE